MKTFSCGIREMLTMSAMQENINLKRKIFVVNLKVLRNIPYGHGRLEIKNSNLLWSSVDVGVWQLRWSKTRTKVRDFYKWLTVFATYQCVNKMAERCRSIRKGRHKRSSSLKMKKI